MYFFTQAFDELCEAGGFSRKSIMSWLEKKKLSLQDQGRVTKVKRINGKLTRCICILIEQGEEPADEGGFVPIPQNEQETLPFV